MRTATLLLGGLVLSAFLSAPAIAEPVRVKVTARVSSISDPGNLLDGKVIVGQRVNGTYVYNTNTPNTPPFPGLNGGFYTPYANEARLRFAAGGWVFENVQPTQGITITISPNTQWSDGQFTMNSTQNKQLPNGTSISTIWMEYRGAGNITASAALPTVAPNLTGYLTKTVNISGGNASNSFMMMAQIEAAELIESEAFGISPASGAFVQGQHFDAALTLPRNSVVASAQASANGMPLPLTYPGHCSVYGPNSANQPVLVCPNAEQSLFPAAGAPIEWKVTLANGTVLTQTVTWELVQ